MDVQENALIAGKRPPMEDWGQDLAEDYGMLYTIENGEERSVKVPTEIGNYGAYYDNIYHVLTEGAELFVKPEETVDVLKIIEMAQKSHETGRRIK